MRGLPVIKEFFFYQENRKSTMQDISRLKISARYNSAQTNINRDVFPHIEEFFIIIIYIHLF